MPYWLLPEFIEDILPKEAALQETLRRRLLDLFDRHGFDLVVPPLIEYIESLLPDSSAKANLRTFRLTDQMSGRTLGLRADTTPQVARIDAHLLSKEGINRLCYTGSVLHTLPANFLSTRQPVQIGAEIFGTTSLMADLEVLRLAIEALKTAGISDFQLDLGHIGILRTLAGEMQLADAQLDAFYEAFKLKDISLIEEITENWPAKWKDAAILLMKLYGGVEVMQKARELLPDHPAIDEALDSLDTLITALGETVNVSVDLAQVRSYRYHTGLVFSIHSPDTSELLCRGGRYDGIGEYFGRKRPATGFSMDLRTLCAVSPVQINQDNCVYAPLCPEDHRLKTKIAVLRNEGIRVIVGFCQDASDRHQHGCSQQLIFRDDDWKVIDLQ